MDVGMQSRCKHVYLHVDRRFQSRGHGKGLVPIWRCTLKRKNPEGVCAELTKVGLVTSCHPEECPLVSRHLTWDKCPLYVPKK